MEIFKNISSTELIIILLLLVIVFGSKTISDLVKRGGKTYREVKKIKKEILEVAKDDPASQ